MDALACFWLALGFWFGCWVLAAAWTEKGVPLDSCDRERLRREKMIYTLVRESMARGLCAEKAIDECKALEAYIFNEEGQ